MYHIIKITDGQKSYLSFGGNWFEKNSPIKKGTFDYKTAKLLMLVLSRDVQYINDIIDTEKEA